MYKPAVASDQSSSDEEYTEDMSERLTGIYILNCNSYTKVLYCTIYTKVLLHFNVCECGHCVMETPAECICCDQTRCKLAEFVSSSQLVLRYMKVSSLFGCMGVADKAYNAYRQHGTDDRPVHE